MIDLSIENGKIVTSDMILESSIKIDEGKIVGISILPERNANRVIDATNLLIFPGFIDAHVHFLEPVGAEKETFQSGTRAAASGGITTVYEMPGIEPAVISAEAMEEKKKIAAREAIVDYGLFGGAGMGNLDAIVQLANNGVIGFKTFMTYESAYQARNDSELLQIFETVSKTGLRSAVHAEIGDLVETLSRRLQANYGNSPDAHPRSRPSIVESLAIQRIIEIARFVKAKAHIVHMSTRAGRDLVRAAKMVHDDITAETCPHYILLTEDAMSGLGPYAKVNPPLRTREDQASLWEGLRDGTIDLIASDHAPCSKQEKEIGWKDIWKAGAGNPGLESMAILILSKVREGILTYQDVARLMSTMPAKIYCTFPTKGAINIGSDADLTLVDMNANATILRENLESVSAFATLYDGWNVTCVSAFTIVRGTVVAERGQIIGRAGSGRLVIPFERLARQSDRNSCLKVK